MSTVVLDAPINERTPHLRSFQSDLEIRSDGDGRTVHGIAVPFGQKTRIIERGRRFDESFRYGSFAKTIAEAAHHDFARVKFFANHQKRKLPLGRALMLREDTAGLYCEMRASKTREGDEILELIRDGAIDAFSIGFIPILGDPMDFFRNRERTEVEWVEVALREISAVTFPAYAGAAIEGVRAEDAADEDPTEDLSPEDEAAGDGTSDRADAATESADATSPTGLTRGERDAYLRRQYLKEK